MAAMLIISSLGYAGGRRCQIFFLGVRLKAVSRHHPSAGVALVVAVVVIM